MSTLKLLQEAASTKDLAHLLGFKAASIAYLVRVTPPALRYKSFEIPKRSGGKRTISAPESGLKLLQRRLADLLQACQHEIEVLRKVNRPLAHGFKKGYSTLTNAERHRGRRLVFNIDLEDFFGGINFGRVRGFLMKNQDFNLNENVATTIAQICCHQNSLPQGAPTSPVVSNLIAHILDIRLSKLAKKNHCSYTRYADDITFSTSVAEFSQKIVAKNSDHPHLWEPGKELKQIIELCGFKINSKKTRLQYRRSRQEVTGIVVNTKLNAPKEYRRAIRAMVHRFCSTGNYSRRVAILSATGDTTIVEQEGRPKRLAGMLNYVHSIEKWRERNAKEDKKKKPLSNIESLIEEFTFYSEFANPAMPAVIFEGKTDYIYLREAIISLQKKFPSLAKEGTVSGLRVKLHRNTNLFGRVFGLNGGSGTLKNFVETYRTKFREFKGPKGGNPVVVVADSDSGLKDLKHLIKQSYKFDLIAGQQYFHIAENLYLLLTCKFDLNQSHCIEDCFDKKTLSFKLGEKIFNPSNKIDTKTQFGKGWFAEKIVAAQASSIDFSGFEPMLDSLSSIIANHPDTIASA